MSADQSPRAGDGKLPTLPEWALRDDLGGLVPSEIRSGLRAYARQAVYEAEEAWQACPAATVAKVWCDTCNGSGKVFQEHQAGCWVGGDHDCPDCDGKGYSERSAQAATPAAAPAWQPGAPLTEQQIVNDGLMMCPTKLLDNCADAFEAGVKFAERAHGIQAQAPATAAGSQS